MKVLTITILTILFFNLNTHGQTRTIVGRVICEDLEPLPSLDIENSENVILGKTDLEGRFRISITQETDSLIFRYIGMESTVIGLKRDCDTVEVVMMVDMIYDFMTSRKIDRLRKKRFDNLSGIHSDAVKKGLFENQTICYERFFKSDKPILDSISEVSKKKREVIKNDFTDLKTGDIVKIPFGLDSSGKRINTFYSPCLTCTEEDYDFHIEGEILNKKKRKLTLEIKITKMKQYDSLEFRGEDLNIGSSFKYEMEYFEVIINK